MKICETRPTWIEPVLAFFVVTLNSITLFFLVFFASKLENKCIEYEAVKGVNSLMLIMWKFRNYC